MTLFLARMRPSRRREPASAAAHVFMIALMFRSIVVGTDGSDTAGKAVAEAIGIGKTPLVAVSYFIVAAILFACARYTSVAPKPAEVPEGHGHGAPAVG